MLHHIFGHLIISSIIIKNAIEKLFLLPRYQFEDLVFYVGCKFLVERRVHAKLYVELKVDLEHSKEIFNDFLFKLSGTVLLVVFNRIAIYHVFLFIQDINNTTFNFIYFGQILSDFT